MAKQSSSRSNQKGNNQPPQSASTNSTPAAPKPSSAPPSAKKTASTTPPRTRRGAAPAPKPRISPVTIGVVAVLAAAVVMFLVFWNQQRTATPAAPVPLATGIVKDADRFNVGVTPEGYAFKGNPDAKVTIENFSDFQCPYCAAFATGVEPRLEQDFVKTGRVKYVFRDFQFLDRNSDGTPNLDGESHRAALAAHCALDQGMFWAYHDSLYRNQPKAENSGGFSDDKLQALAAQLGLNMDTFNACMKSKASSVNAILNKSLNEPPAKQVQGTPTLFINGRKIENPDYDSVKAAIELSERNP